MLGQEQVVFCSYTIFNFAEVREGHEHVCVVAQRIRPRPSPHGRTQASSQVSAIDVTQSARTSKSMK